MADQVELKILFDGKIYGSKRKISYTASDKNMVFREAINALNFIYEQLEKDLLEEAIAKSKEDE